MNTKQTCARLWWAQFVTVSVTTMAVTVPVAAQDGKTIFGDSRQQTLKAMRQMVKSIGVKNKGGCLFCHVKEKGKMNFVVDTPHKQITRQMKISLIDSLTSKGRAEVTITEEGENLLITADYRRDGEMPGIHLQATLTTQGAKESPPQSFSTVVPFPEKGGAISCMPCHNGSKHFLTEPIGK